MTPHIILLLIVGAIILITAAELLGGSGNIGIEARICPVCQEFFGPRSNVVKVRGPARIIAKHEGQGMRIPEDGSALVHQHHDIEDDDETTVVSP